MRARSWLLVVGLTVGLGAGSAATRADVPDVYHARRYSALNDDLMKALLVRASEFPASPDPDKRGPREWLESVHYRLDHRPTQSMSQDIAEAKWAAYYVDMGERKSKVPVEYYDLELADAMKGVVAGAVGMVQLHIEYLNDWVTLLEQDNPALHLNGTRRLIQKATDQLDKSLVGLSYTHQLASIASASMKADKAESSFKLGRPPKSAHLRSLRKGEFCYAASVGDGVFRANAGQAWYSTDLAGNVTGAKISFWYADGHNPNLQWLDFRIVGITPGIYPQDNNVGGYRRGLGFQLSLGAGSAVEITNFDVANQVIEGKFDFTALGAIFSGGRFRLQEISD